MVDYTSEGINSEGIKGTAKIKYPTELSVIKWENGLDNTF